MDKKHVEPTPDNFESYEAAADFWDSHDTTDYLDEFRTVEVNTDLRARHFEVEIDENVAKALQVQAKEKGVKVSDLASSLLRQQLGLAR
ncbi:MAG: CopG family antitoxin [Pyrinomonadaceae bacterium]